MSATQHFGMNLRRNNTFRINFQDISVNHQQKWLSTKFFRFSGSLKAHSHDPSLRIRFLVPKIGSRCSDGPISRFRFCSENVRRSFIVCSHDPIFRTNKESLIWRQNDHRDIMQNLSAPFIFQEECRMKLEHVLFPSVFSKLRICMSEGHFQRVHTILFTEPTKVGSLKMDRVNGSLGEFSVSLGKLRNLSVNSGKNPFDKTRETIFLANFSWNMIKCLLTGFTLAAPGLRSPSSLLKAWTKSSRKLGLVNPARPY